MSTFTSGTTTDKGKNVSVAVKIILVICLVCFFLPFVTVSCGDMVVTEATGLEAATGKEIDGQKFDPNIFVILYVAATAIALAIAFTKKDKKSMTALSVVAAACLILFMITFKGYYDLDGAEMGESVSVKFNFAVWASIILHIVSVFLLNADLDKINAIYPGLGGSSRDGMKMAGEYLGTKPAISHCPNCGSPVDAGATFCPNCGSSVTGGHTPSRPETPVAPTPASDKNNFTNAGDL